MKSDYDEFSTDTIRISPSVKEMLKKMKIHPREPYSSIIYRLIKEVKDEPRK